MLHMCVEDVSRFLPEVLLTSRVGELDQCEEQGKWGEGEPISSRCCTFDFCGPGSG